MKLGIDASNCRAQGGLTHLVELLRSAEPHSFGFNRVFVWAGQATLSYIEDRPWLVKVHEPVLDKNLLYRVLWQFQKLDRLVRAAECDVLFVPGGSYVGNIRPYVTMNQNMLPFDWHETFRYGFSASLLRNILLHYVQSSTYQKAQGLIFLTYHARDVVMKFIEKFHGTLAVIPHGINDKFRLIPRVQYNISNYSPKHPFKIIYVSPVDFYKHQWHVAEAIAHLYMSGLPVQLDMIGPINQPKAMRRLQHTMNRLDPDGLFMRYLGPIPYDDLHKKYISSDACIFASSCETFAMTLLEGMAAGVPTACANRGPLPEVLGDAGWYFDPENPQDIASKLRHMIESTALRTEKASKAFERVQAFSWKRCCAETFQLLADVAHNKKEKV